MTKTRYFVDFIKIIWRVAEIKQEEQGIQPMQEGMNRLSGRKKGKTGGPQKITHFRPKLAARTDKALRCEA
jgi:hypothetical protein